MDDMDKTIPPLRAQTFSGVDDMTMPGRRIRKPDGRFAAGDLIMNRYKILAELGQGGMGVVYRCLDETAGIEVALKALPPELSHNTLEMEDIKENFQLVAKLIHQNIAVSKNLERDSSNGNYYLIMECCEGEDLRRWIRRKRKEGSLTPEEVIPVIHQVADALDYAHSEEVIHRDIKPGNIMISSAGKVKVLDFGLAAQIHTSMTRVSMAYHGTSGTGPYMAPEQWRGRAQGAPADQYALAVMTYEMLAGHLPFESPDPAVLKQAVLDEDPEEISSVPQTVRDAVKRAMSKDPSARFASCSDFVAALGGKTNKKVQRSGKNRFPVWAAVLIIAAMVLGGAGYYSFNKYSKERARQEQLAAEKLRQEQDRRAEEERQRQITAEKLRQEQDRRAEEERLDSENAALKVELSSRIAEIEKKNYDPAQSFGQKIREMKIAYATAQEAKMLSTINKKYKEAKALADWLLLNGEKREAVKTLRGKVQSNRSAAEEYEPRTYAREIYSNALALADSAEKLYNEAKFTEAEKLFENAAKTFEQTRNSAFDNKLKFMSAQAENAEKSGRWALLKVWAEKIRPLNSALADQFKEKAEKELKAAALERKLAAARQAKSEKEWQKMYDHAVAALQIESGSQEARNLKLEAENNLQPSYSVMPILNGKGLTGRLYRRALKNRPLENDKLVPGKEYEFLYTHERDGVVYKGKLSFVCDWKGRKTFAVILKQDQIAELAEKYGLILSEDKKTVTGVKNKNITSVVIPYGITTIGRSAFYECGNLTDVTIPSSVTTIEKYAFAFCNLSRVIIPDSVVTIGADAFFNSENMTYLKLGKNVKYIGDGAFYGCKKLTELTIPDSVVTIGKKAFEYGKNLTSLKLGNSVQNIGREAFYCCEKLTEVTIPDSVTRIEYWAFNFCQKITRINMGRGVRYIGDKAFWLCHDLPHVTIPRNCKLGNQVFPNRCRVYRR